MQEDKTFVEKLSFDKVYRIYEFDRKLRNLLLTALEVIEISLRARLAHFHSEKYGPQGYLNASNFNKSINQPCLRIRLISQSAIIKRLRLSGIILKSMTGISPCGLSPSCSHSVCFHVFTVTLRRQIKSFAGVDHKHTVSWLKCCTDLRNICAHYGRLYCRVFRHYHPAFSFPNLPAADCGARFFQ